MRRLTATVAAAVALLAGGCGTGVDAPVTGAASTSPSDRTTVATRATTTSAPATSTIPVPTTVTTPASPVVEIALRFDQRTSDPATATFGEVAQAVLTDARGWERAGFRFTFRPDAPYTVLLAEPSDVDAACAPYDVQSTYSCQIGPTVALNADRWRHGTTTWTGSIDEYRAMLVNHEVGHLLGQHHPDDRCPVAGAPAPVMAQQSKGLEGCLANPWPLDWEIVCAARHDEPLAPGYEPSSVPHCGPQG